MEQSSSRNKLQEISMKLNSNEPIFVVKLKTDRQRYKMKKQKFVHSHTMIGKYQLVHTQMS